jgi:hypothetical protein
MRKIPKKHLPLTMMLLTSLSTIVNADTLDRQIISAGGDHIVASGNAITYTLGQPFVFPNPSSSLQIGFLHSQSSGGIIDNDNGCDTTQAEWACVEFQGFKDSYQVGDSIKIDIVLNVKGDRFNRADLWVALQFPSGDLFFKTDMLVNSFAPAPQAFKESLETLEISHRFVDLELVPGLGGTYVFYALYVTEGTNPLEHLDDLASIQRSELVIKATTLANN